ncbi:MAG: GIY-YIG nuclease family protein [Ruminococcaceae bacterium]|nr:GIY-YIG nuclease family protein [Oscillospiraceae bacterium]
MYYVYILRCEDNSLYTGITNDVEKRMNEHFGDSDKKAKYTKSHKPKELAALWKCNTRNDALKIEYRLKELNKKEKENLIENNIAPESICIKLMDIDFERVNTEEIIISH